MNSHSAAGSFFGFASSFLLLIALSFGITIAVNAYISTQQKAEVAAAALTELVARQPPVDSGAVAR
jgi:hypothetical protein